MRQIFFGWILMLGFWSAPGHLWAQKTKILPPPSFSFKDGTQAVFMNILRAKTVLVLDVENKTSEAITQIEFKTWEDGHPVFDLIPNPSEVSLNDEPIKTKVIDTPSRASKLRMMEPFVSAGTHILSVRHSLKAGLRFRRVQVSLGFWYSDLEDRKFLEQFLPTNLEFDTYANTLRLKVVGTANAHVLFTNGTSKEIEFNEWEVSYPEFYNCASLFLHLGPVTEFQVMRTDFKSISGKSLPVTVYGKVDEDVLLAFNSRAHEVLKELEKDYGAFPHAQMLIYANQSFQGGMEYAGATVTDLWALAHEITHSYFGRAVMPNGGNAGWIDEAVASWRDSNYPRLEDPGFHQGNLASFSAYQRFTPSAAYTKGRNFIGYLDGKLAEKGKSMKAFLRHLLESQAFEPLSTPFFKKWVEEAYGDSLDDDFFQYVFNRDPNQWIDEDVPPPSPYHPILTQEQLDGLL